MGSSARVLAVSLWIGVGATACTGDEVASEPDDTGTTAHDADSGDPQGSTGLGSSSGDPGESSGADTSTGSDSSADSSTGDPEPVVTCTEQGCERSCSFVQELELDDGEVCECTSGTDAEDRVACELPPLCLDGGHLCRIQALRYGIAGHFVVYFDFGIKGSGESRIEVLGDGRARALTYTQDHTCCSGVSVDSQQIEGFPVSLPSGADPIWQSCLAMIPDEIGYDELPECYDPPTFGACACEGPLQACPDVTPHVPGCDAACPMANDGICDEAIGTGLCADGCDPIDCTCADNRVGHCDEISNRNGTCPLGSDGDDCPG